jgi:hypothetical protein
MTTLELKNSIIQRISEIEDIRFLKAVKSILDSAPEKDVLILNEGQIKEISQSREDYANGLFIDAQTVNEKVEKWAKEK